jgi:hypothetical protein
MKFMQQNDIINVAKKLGLDLNIKHKDKEQLCDEIEIAAWKIQNKIYPKRVIYKRFEIPQSI